jgi:CheY-like chemotaxis protein
MRENYDLSVDDACNGAIAVEKYKAALDKPCGCIDRSYRLILMDLQMPVMGGLEASKKILDLCKDEN